MKVRRIAHTQLDWDADNLEIEALGYDLHLASDIDNLHEAGGRGCYESWGRPNPKTATNEGYLAHILEIDHESVLEHGSITYHLSEVSRAFMAELERSRHFSYSILSQRYVDHSASNVVIPPEFDDELARRLDNHNNKAREHYSFAVERLQSQGKDRKTARGAARHFLPEATETKILVTGNIRALRLFFKQRIHASADVEIRNVAREMLRLALEVAPNSLQDLRPLLEVK